MLANTARACATTSSPPTSSRVLVDGHDAADEQEVAGLDGVGEVRDRLGLPGDPVLAAQRTLQARGTRPRRAPSRVEGARRSSLCWRGRRPCTLTWKSRSRRVRRPTAPRPAKQSNVPRRSFMAERGRRLVPPIESCQPMTTTAAPSEGTRYEDTWQSLSIALTPSVPMTRSVRGSSARRVAGDDLRPAVRQRELDTARARRRRPSSPTVASRRRRPPGRGQRSRESDRPTSHGGPNGTCDCGGKGRTTCTDVVFSGPGAYPSG